MLIVRAEDYDAALDRVETDLAGLGRVLDRGVPDEMFATAALALGIRARTLFTGFITLVRSDVPIAALALMRPTIEINLAMRFLAANPELHTELWVAEGERQAAILVREVEADPVLLGKTGDEPIPSEWHADKRELVMRARAKALAAGGPTTNQNSHNKWTEKRGPVTAVLLTPLVRRQWAGCRSRAPGRSAATPARFPSSSPPASAP